MSLMMLTVGTIFFPTSPDGAAGVEAFESSPNTVERFFKNGMNYILYHKIALICSVVYIIFDMFLFDWIVACLEMCKCKKPHVKEFAAD